MPSLTSDIHEGVQQHETIYPSREMCSRGDVQRGGHRVSAKKESAFRSKTEKARGLESGECARAHRAKIFSSAGHLPISIVVDRTAGVILTSVGS